MVQVYIRHAILAGIDESDCFASSMAAYLPLFVATVEDKSVSQETPQPSDACTRLAGDRTNLARFRTQLALDRTTLAWIRTTLTMASFGFGLVAFFRTLREKSPDEETIRLHEGAIRFGAALIVLGLVATILASLSHWFSLRKLRRGESPVLGQGPLSITVAMLFAVLCIGGLWTLFVR